MSPRFVAAGRVFRAGADGQRKPLISFLTGPVLALSFVVASCQSRSKRYAWNKACCSIYGRICGTQEAFQRFPVLGDVVNSSSAAGKILLVSWKLCSAKPNC